MHNKTHLGLKGETMPLTCLIAGDPQRVKRMCSLWDSPRTVADNRGYLCVAGRYRGIELAACCTGIGGPSCEIAVVELAQHRGEVRTLRRPAAGLTRRWSRATSRS